MQTVLRIAIKKPQSRNRGLEKHSSIGTMWHTGLIESKQNYYVHLYYRGNPEPKE